MGFKRFLFNNLTQWKIKPNRKPLVLRGARQVGKTTLVRDFGKSYNQFLYLNLEKEAHRAYFENSDEVPQIVDSLFLNFNLKSDFSNTLLFIDEIQESPKAIQLLRYFYEEIPELHVISAGSLLEFAMKEIQSFPVGRVAFMYLFPMNFPEFVSAIGHENALKALEEIPVKTMAHQTLQGLFHTYAIVGGMPEVVKSYVESGILGLSEIYEGIWSAYAADVEKYARNETERKVINHIVASAQYYLDERISFQNFGNSNYRSREVGEAFRALHDAKVIQLVYPTTATEFPLIPDLKKSPRLQFLDTGLVNHALKIQHEMLGLKDLSDAYKGAVIPHLITQELISLNKTSYQPPVFWVREKKQSSAEVDLLYTFNGIAIPIEIKSGATGKLRSLHQFMETSPHQFAVRVYGGKLEMNDIETTHGKKYKLLNLPYYLGTKIPEYIEWFVNQENKNNSM